jgi:UDP-N-acetylglucosamine 2-epimerase
LIRQNSERFQTFKNVSPESYAGLLKSAACAIGNSSSFIRDSSRFGTPVVLVGSRQDGRERGENVMRVEPVAAEISRSINMQLAAGPYEPSDLYGAPGISQRIVEALVNVEPYRQKRLDYQAYSASFGGSGGSGIYVGDSGGFFNCVVE